MCFYEKWNRQLLVSSLEKSSKKSPSPSAPPSNQSKSFNIIKPHHDDPHDDKKSPPDAPIDANSNSRSVAANSLDLSSDDDHVDNKLSGPSGSSTTTTSSSFIDSKQKNSLLSFDEELKSFMNNASNDEKSESEKENVLINENYMKHKSDEQKSSARDSVSSIGSIHLKNGNDTKVNIRCNILRLCVQENLWFFDDDYHNLSRIRNYFWRKT